MNHGVDGISRNLAIFGRDRGRRKGHHSHGWSRGTFNNNVKDRGKRRFHYSRQSAQLNIAIHCFSGLDKELGLNVNVVGERDLEHLLRVVTFRLRHLFHPRTQHVHSAANSSCSAAHLGDFGQATVFRINGSEARTKQAHGCHMLIDDRQTGSNGNVSIVTQSKRDDVGLQLGIQLELGLEKVNQRCVGMRLPKFCLRLRFVVQDELEELHERTLRLRWDGSIGKYILAGRRDSAQGRDGLGFGRRLEDVKRAHGKELNLPECLGGHQLRDQFCLCVNKLGGQGQAIRSRRGWSLAVLRDLHIGKGAIGTRGLMLSSPLLHLLQTQSSLGLSIVLVRIDVKNILARSRQGTLKSKGRRGEKGLLEPSAADHYIPLGI
ncbi:unnamed protein product [Clonostachys rosea f. rosea IK726]|uniref:Uncharacterized protein n=1 Tax=Clonostachys rosea f. rosea IK726 TaxID=1349383 RepID=A0ACA9THS6_BIOOC|nr:unnamed protein product [Clonostachys rosea f. rosea IK726]